MDGTCKDCRYWTHDQWHQRHIHGGPAMGGCALVVYDDTATEENRRDRIVVSENGVCGVETGEDFGCIHFTAKEARD